MKLDGRMKQFENRNKLFLQNRMPVIIRIDGKAFRTFTKGLDRPFDRTLGDAMAQTTLKLVNSIQNCIFGYTQSDEISLLLLDTKTFDTAAWFDNNQQKLVSVSASIATATFNSIFKNPRGELALFDSRAFNLTMEEVDNYFIWRQQDCTKNSVNMLGRSLFSHKELQGKNGSQIQDLLMLEKGVNWNDIETRFKRGTCVYSGAIDNEMPILTQDREFLPRIIKDFLCVQDK